MGLSELLRIRPSGRRAALVVSRRRQSRARILNRHFTQIDRLERLLRGVSNRELEKFCRIIIRFQRIPPWLTWLTVPFKREEALANLVMIFENDSEMWQILRQLKNRENAAAVRRLRRFCKHEGITIQQWFRGDVPKGSR